MIPWCCRDENWLALFYWCSSMNLSAMANQLTKARRRSGAGTPPASKPDPSSPSGSCGPKARFADCPTRLRLVICWARRLLERRHRSPQLRHLLRKTGCQSCEDTPSVAKAPPPRTDGPAPSASASPRPEGYPTRERVSQIYVYTIRCNELLGLNMSEHCASRL